MIEVLLFKKVRTSSLSFSLTRAGIKHYDLYFMDGSAPSESILRRFLEIAESEPGSFFKYF